MTIYELEKGKSYKTTRGVIVIIEIYIETKVVGFISGQNVHWVTWEKLKGELIK